MNNPGNILVVDDDVVYLTLLTSKLKRDGYIATKAQNGRQALEILQSQPFDVVLLDIQMPEDELVKGYGLEKIKTIGDSYMIVGGLPTPRPDHAEAVAEMALDMQKGIARFNTVRGESLHIRVGMNTGPVVAGIIGTTKFSYDLWGDTVNTASRMESHGVEDSIQVTAATYERLKDKYVLEDRGVIQVKGKGEMKTYLLTGRKAA